MDFKIALAQLDFTVGDITGNTAKIIKYIQRADKQKADLVVFGEMAIVGYPPEDLVLRPSFRKNAMKAVDEIARVTKTSHCDVIVGGIWFEGEKIYNTAFLISAGEVVFKQYKKMLPNFGVFDEVRVFTRPKQQELFEWRGIKMALLICEDLWHEDNVVAIAAQTPDVIISINASPYEREKIHQRHAVTEVFAKKYELPIIYLNSVGCQDDLVFDGRSFIFNKSGTECMRLKAFEEDFEIARFAKSPHFRCKESRDIYWEDGDEIIYKALKCSIAGYVNKNRFNGVLLGVSGGIDSALVAALAVDALGPEKVKAFYLPSVFSSDESKNDARALAKNLGLKLQDIEITNVFEAMKDSLAPVFKNRAEDVTEENLQSRIRGNLLMAISNKLGLMLLATGNKSEFSCGYSTLYGDMCGGYAPLKDVYKTKVFKLARWRNKDSEVIPDNIITKAPTAELKANQKDTDSLPEYEILDAVLLELIEHQEPVEDVIFKGFNRDVVEKVSKMLYGSEFKRRQSPPGPKVTDMAFGRDRRYPITNRYIYAKV